jgi:hypothetical protein
MLEIHLKLDLLLDDEGEHLLCIFHQVKFIQEIYLYDPDVVPSTFYIFDFKMHPREIILQEIGSSR